MKRTLMLILAAAALAATVEPAAAREPRRPFTDIQIDTAAGHVICTRAGDVDLASLTRELKQEIPDCTGVSRAGDTIIVHTKAEAPRALRARIEGIVALHTPPVRRHVRPDFEELKEQYRLAATLEEKVDILARWLDLAE